MAKLTFVRKAPQIELEAGGVQYNKSAIIVVGVLTLCFVGMAIALYAMKQPDPARAVIDLAVAFLAWSTGKAVGEKAGLENR